MVAEGNRVILNCICLIGGIDLIRLGLVMVTCGIAKRNSINNDVVSIFCSPLLFLLVEISKHFTIASDELNREYVHSTIVSTSLRLKIANQVARRGVNAKGDVH